MVQRRQYAKLGMFLVSVTVLLLLSLALVGGLNLWRKTDTYWVMTESSVEGLVAESPVTMRGVQIGRVEEIALDRSDFGRVRVRLSVDPSIAIPADSEAFFRRSGLTGEKGIDIDGGTLRSGRILPGSAIPRGQTTLEGLESQAEVVMANLTKVSEETTQAVTRVNELIATVRPEQVEKLVARADRIAESIESASEGLDETLEVGRKGVVRVVDDVHAIRNSTTTAVDNADRDLSRLLRHIDVMLSVNEDDLRATMSNVRRTSREAEHLARALRQQPSLLLLSKPQPERERR